MKNSPLFSEHVKMKNRIILLIKEGKTKETILEMIKSEFSSYWHQSTIEESIEILIMANTNDSK